MRGLGCWWCSGAEWGWGNPGNRAGGGPGVVARKMGPIEKRQKDISGGHDYGTFAKLWGGRIDVSRGLQLLSDKEVRK